VKYLFILLLFTVSCQLSAAPSKERATFALGELLYWQLREGSDENWSQFITPTGPEQSVTLFDAPFQWNPGFRLGLGYDARAEAWDTVLYYTNYTTEAKNHASGDIYSAYLGNYFANNTTGAHFGPTYSSASIRWDFSFQTIDLELGRKFKTDHLLMLRPFVALKTAFIDQEIHTHWYGPKSISSFSTATEKLENNYWGIGPALGLDTTWQLYHSSRQAFNLIGNISGAIMWGQWSFSDEYQNTTPVTIKVHSSDIVGASTMARGILGLEWNKHFSEIDLNLRLAYEAQVWFDQLQYYNYNMGRLDNLMSLQGVNLGVSINY
jgi:hypothetical protein